MIKHKIDRPRITSFSCETLKVIRNFHDATRSSCTSIWIYEFLTEVFLFHCTAPSKSAKEAFLRFKNIKGFKEGNKSPTELRVMALAYILRIVLNGLLWPPWAFVWCFDKLKTLQRRFFPVLQGNCHNPFSLAPFKRLFKGQSIRKCVVRI